MTKERSAPAGAAISAISDKRRWFVLFLLCLAFIAAYFDRVNLSVVLAAKDFVREFSLTDTQRGVLNAAFFMAYAPMQLVAGYLVDRFGSKVTLAIGFVIWSVFSALCGIAEGFAALLFFRVMLGIGEAVVFPGGMRFIRFNFPEERRGTAVGIYQAAAKVGPALGYPLAGWLMHSYGWRPMFFIMGVGSLVWLVPWLLAAPADGRTVTPASATPSPASMNLASASQASASQASASQASASQASASQAKTASAISFQDVMKSRAIWGTLIGTFSYQYFLYFCMTWMPAYLAERRGLSLSSSNWYSGSTFLCMAGVAILGGFWADRLIARGRDAIKIRKTFAIAGLLLASTELVGAFSTSLPVALTFAVFSLSGLGLMTANYWALTQTLTPGPLVGRMLGLQNFVANVPGIVAPIMTGWLKQVTGSYEAPMLLIAVLLFTGIGAYVFLVKREYAPARSAA